MDGASTGCKKCVLHTEHLAKLNANAKYAAEKNNDKQIITP
jgi:hypothetical protein